MTPGEFVAKWSGSTRTERAASQEHFIDLCRMLGYQTPNEADPRGDWYAFEKDAKKTAGGDGFADVWKRGKFAWEYKGKKKDLDAAYQQLLQYRETLENPPLLVVCDLDRFQIHTNFTGTAKKIYAFSLADMGKDPREPIRLLRAVMESPDVLRPTTSRQELTELAAQHFAELADNLRDRGHDPQRVAHFLNKLLFCMFAEDAGLLPPGLIKRLVDGTKSNPPAFAAALSELFGKMAKEGGLFGVEVIHWFNGGLFDNSDVVPLEAKEIAVVQEVSKLDWSQVEPAIFGTLFERGLDPDKRSQLGAHYTDKASIARIVEPVLITPLRREFEAMKTRVTELAPKATKVTKRTAAVANPHKVFQAFLDRVRSVRVLDPACGSGNFLYVALQSLKDLEREALLWGSLTLSTTQAFPEVGPQVLHGIELNIYAAELARVTIWIGEIQWMLQNGFAYLKDPILRPLDSISNWDAILDVSDASNPKEPTWPDADVIIGNPPFLGGKLLRRGLGDAYVEALYRLYAGRVPAEADLVCYWHEKARAMIAAHRVRRVGLLATQGIRGGANRRVLERIKETGDIFMAWSDEPWVVEGAAVHVSLLGYDDGSEKERMLNGQPVATINANLTAGIDLTKARPLKENLGVAFMGDTKGGPFEIPGSLAAQMVQQPNPDGRSNRDVLHPWINGLDITRRPRGMWIIDFGTGMTLAEAAKYEAPFEYAKLHVEPQRLLSKTTIKQWWLHERPRVEMRAAIAGRPRFIATPRVSKHRLFVWLPAGTLPDSATIALARDDNYTFGVLQSGPHELWARGMGTQLREVESGFRYTPTTTFETFPFPKPSGAQRAAISNAGKELDTLRNGWLNPAGITGRELEKRTLTELYNALPTWLLQAHNSLNKAVFDAYGWNATLSNDEILSRLLALNVQREAAGTPIAEHEVADDDFEVLAAPE